MNAAELPALYATGEGKIKIRAKTEIEPGESGRKNIVITEIPYTAAGSKSRLVESLTALMKDKVFDEIYDVRDESNKEGIRIVIEVKRDRNIDNLLNGLYKKTPLEDTYGANLLAVKRQQPYTFTLKTLLQEFIVFQEELYTKEFEHLLRRAQDRLEVVNGLIRATDVIDLIIEILRGSSSLAQAKACLIEGITDEIRFKSAKSEKQARTLQFTQRQAEAILAMPLSRLIGLEILKLHEESSSLVEQIASYEKILSVPEELHKVIKSRLKEYKKQFNRPRRTVLTNAETSGYVEEKKVEDIYVLVDRFGYIKSIDAAGFSRASEDNLKDFVHTVRMKNTDKLCLFTAQGNLYYIKAQAIPRGRIRDKGVLVQTLCKADKEDILLYTSFETLFESQLLFTTRQGYIKLVSGIEFETNRSCIGTTRLEDGDTIAGLLLLSAADILNGSMKVVILTEKGLSLGFPLAEVSELKKSSRGVKGITLDAGDFVLFASAFRPEEETFQVNAKTLSVKKVRCRKRAAKGQKAALEV